MGRLRCVRLDRPTGRIWRRAERSDGLGESGQDTGSPDQANYSNIVLEYRVSNLLDRYRGDRRDGGQVHAGPNSRRKPASRISSGRASSLARVEDEAGRGRPRISALLDFIPERGKNGHERANQSVEPGTRAVGRQSLVSQGRLGFR